MKLLAAVLSILFVSGLAHSQQKPRVCVWVDGESTMKMHGDSIVAPAKSAITRIRQRAVARLRKDDSIAVVDPCPQTGENIELDVVVGQFRGGYVASVSIVLQGMGAKRDTPGHLSSNIIAANSEEVLALDIGWAFESAKLGALGIGSSK